MAASNDFTVDDLVEALDSGLPAALLDLARTRLTCVWDEQHDDDVELSSVEITMAPVRAATGSRGTAITVEQFEALRAGEWSTTNWHIADDVAWMSGAASGALMSLWRDIVKARETCAFDDAYTDLEGTFPVGAARYDVAAAYARRLATQRWNLVSKHAGLPAMGRGGSGAWDPRLCEIVEALADDVREACRHLDGVIADWREAAGPDTALAELRQAFGGGSPAGTWMMSLGREESSARIGCLAFADHVHVDHCGTGAVWLWWSGTDPRCAPYKASATEAVLTTSEMAAVAAIVDGNAKRLSKAVSAVTRLRAAKKAA